MGQSVPPQALPGQSAKKTSKLTEDERQILREHRQKIRGTPAPATSTPPSTPPSPVAAPPTPVDPKILQDDALTKLRTARGGGATLRIERGNSEAFDQLAKDIANVSDQYADPKQQYEVMEALARKAAQQNTKGKPNKLDEFFNDLYGRVLDVKKKVVAPVDVVPTPTPVIAPASPAPVVQPPPPIDRSLLKGYKAKRRGEDLDRLPTRKEIKEANKILALGKGKYKKKEYDTAQGVQDLRRDILEGRFRATKERKRELGLYSDDRIRPESKKKIKFKTKYTREEYEKYLETARLLDEQRKKRIAEAINDVIKEAKQ